jgi:hypothetical protein
MFSCSDGNDLHGKRGCGVGLSLSQSPTLSAVLGLCQETGADHGPEFHYVLCLLV